MNVSNLKRRHWIFISLVIGLALGAVRMGDIEPTGQHVNQLQFELAVTRFTRGQERRPLIENLRIGPPTVDARGREVQYVTGTIRQREYNFEPRAFWYDATIPYPVRAGRLRGREFSNVEEYLQTLSGQFEHITFRTTGASERYKVLAVWTLGSLVIIGGIFPTILGLLTRAGLGPAPDPPKPPEPKRPADPSPKPSRSSVPAGGLTQEDQQRLLELEQAMEQRLAQDRSVSSPASPTSAPAPQQPIRKLQAGPVEPAPVMTEKPEEPREYKGEYYPVARPTRKKSE